MDTNSIVFIATPIGGGRMVHLDYMRSMVKAIRLLGGLIHPYCPILQEGLYVEENRDVLTEMFVRSNCTHMLMVDTDIGWEPEHLLTLLGANKEVITGVYVKKMEPKQFAGEFTGSVDGDLQRAEVVPGGFLLVTRRAVLNIMAHRANEIYRVKEFGNVTALWHGPFERGVICQRDDVAFSRYCAAAGVEMWAHHAVKLRHHGAKIYVP